MSLIIGSSQFQITFRSYLAGLVSPPFVVPLQYDPLFSWTQELDLVLVFSSTPHSVDCVHLAVGFSYMATVIFSLLSSVTINVSKFKYNPFFMISHLLAMA